VQAVAIHLRHRVVAFHCPYAVLHLHSQTGQITVPLAIVGLPLYCGQGGKR
jgi:hypothetical protein